MSIQSRITRGIGYGAVSVSMLGYGVIEAADIVVAGGSGYPVYGIVERPKGLGEILDYAMSDIYESGTADDLPIETREAFAKVVKPYTKSKAKIPDTDKIDWIALEKDIERIEQLLALWEQVLDDEEVIIMAYLNYYH